MLRFVRGGSVGARRARFLAGSAIAISLGASSGCGRGSDAELFALKPGAADAAGEIALDAPIGAEPEPDAAPDAGGTDATVDAPFESELDAPIEGALDAPSD